MVETALLWYSLAGLGLGWGLCWLMHGSRWARRWERPFSVLAIFLAVFWATAFAETWWMHASKGHLDAFAEHGRRQEETRKKTLGVLGELHQAMDVQANRLFTIETAVKRLENDLWHLLPSEQRNYLDLKRRIEVLESK